MPKIINLRSFFAKTGLVKALCYSILLLLLQFNQAVAIEVKDLYQAKVLIKSQQHKQRNRDLKAALETVLIKVGGKTDVVRHPILAQALRKPTAYVIRFRYASQFEQSYLIADFDADKINQLFKQANLPIWGNLRPQVLVWLIQEQVGEVNAPRERSVVAGSSATQLVPLINDFSSQRGLPMLLPLMDLTDASTINIADLWGRFAEPVLDFSARYRPEAVVVIRISEFDGQSHTADDTGDQCLLCQQQTLVQNQWQLDWSFIGEQQRFSQVYQGANKAELLQQVLSDITDDIYQHYALLTSSEQEFLLDVANVDSLANYLKVTEFLQSLSSVESVQLIRADGTSRRFKLGIFGSKQALLSSLKLNRQLQQYIDPLSGGGAEDIPIFFWRQP